MVQTPTRPRRKDPSPAPSTQSTKSEIRAVSVDLDDNVSVASGTSREAVKKSKKKVRIVLENDEETTAESSEVHKVEKKKPAGRQPRKKMVAIQESEENTVHSEVVSQIAPVIIETPAKKVPKTKKEVSVTIEIKQNEEEEKLGRSRRGKRVVYTEESLKVKKRNDIALTSPDSQKSESEIDSPKKAPSAKAAKKANQIEEAVPVNTTKPTKRGRKGKEPVVQQEAVDLTDFPEVPVKSARSTRAASVAESNTSSLNVPKTTKGRAKKQDTDEIESESRSNSPESKKARRVAIKSMDSEPIELNDSAVSRVSATESKETPARRGRKKTEATVEIAEITSAKRGKAKTVKIIEEAPKQDLKVIFYS